MSKQKQQEDCHDQRKGIEVFTFVDTSIINNNASQNASTSTTHRSNQSDVINLVQWNVEGDQVPTINSLAIMPDVSIQQIDGHNSTAEIYMQSVDPYQVFDELDVNMLSEENNPQNEATNPWEWKQNQQSVWFSLTLIVDNNSTQLT